ncbi:MAG: sulfate ABC transporter substrate-binding protein, partial [Elusimicrobia bacterium]|nr:sulfate ABC transporter substrate-binding protein [Elusimicrobiota bacterium]
AWGFALRRKGGDARTAQEFVAKIFRNVPVLDTGARGATITFVERGIGDVLIAWENEAMLVARRMRPGEFQIVTPSLSILAEPPVALVDQVVDKNGTRRLAQAYLEYLYAPEGQAIAARHYYRPRAPAAGFPKMKAFTLAELFGNWGRAQAEHFSDGGSFDRIYQPGARAEAAP